MKTSLKIEGMHCRSCEIILEEMMEEAGVTAEASHEKGEIKLDFDDKKIDLNQIKKMIMNEGYKVV
jgi:copper chaperone CopZ